MCTDLLSGGSLAGLLETRGTCPLVEGPEVEAPVVAHQAAPPGRLADVQVVFEGLAPRHQPFRATTTRVFKQHALLHLHDADRARARKPQELAEVQRRVDRVHSLRRTELQGTSLVPLLHLLLGRLLGNGLRLEILDCGIARVCAVLHHVLVERTAGRAKELGLRARCARRTRF